MPIWLAVSQWWALAMTEYTVKEIGHQWIVYADRLSIGAGADEDSAYSAPLCFDRSRRPKALDKSEGSSPSALTKAINNLVQFRGSAEKAPTVSANALRIRGITCQTSAIGIL
jgi:hypothetical protein